MRFNYLNASPLKAALKGATTGNFNELVDTVTKVPGAIVHAGSVVVNNTVRRGNNTEATPAEATTTEAPKAEEKSAKKA